jgi:DNA (cytosine-5)-methyltransferase 1
MDGYWRNEPDIPRTAKGVKNRVARLKALGNCVVPMQAYPIFRAIMEAEFFDDWRD